MMSGHLPIGQCYSSPVESGLPSRAFVDEAVLEHERRTVLGRAWVCAGRSSDVVHPGAWIRASVAGEDIIVALGEDLELRAFYNVCRHRGTPLVDGESGRAQRIECPYHGWTYACSGRLLEAPHMPEGFDRAAFGLAPVRVASWQGFVFVCLDEQAPALEPWMGEAPAWIDTALLRRSRRIAYDVAANWKLLVANFQESHHFPRVHPELERLTPTQRARSVFREGSKWLGGEMDIVEGHETVSMSGRIGDRTLIVPKERARVVYDAMLFPLWLTSLQPDYFLSYRLEPIAATRTRVIAETFVHPSSPAEMSDVFELWDIINAQDRAICERQQRGVASRGYTPGPYSIADEGVRAFEDMIRKGEA
jgi:Rieske 2Fe-2S family protein